jgi:hypothetical protein
MGHLLGYARVSTTDQQPHLQVDALDRAGCYRVFTETTSGAAFDRPVLAQVLDQLRPGDTLVVWKLDRLGRSLRHLVDTVTGLAGRGVGFRSLQEQVDTTTPGGRLVFHVFAALAEFERTWSGSGPVRGLPPRARPPRRPAVGAVPAQAAGGTGDVRVRALLGGGDGHDPRREPRLDLPPPHQCYESVFGGRWRCPNTSAARRSAAATKEAYTRSVVAPPPPCPRRPATVRRSTPAASSCVAE